MTASMRALTIDEHGPLDRIRYRDDLPVPAIAAPDQVRVRIAAAALNHLDLFVVGGLPGVTITPSWVLGSDAVGRIDAVGSDVTSVAVGDRVIINPGVSCGACDYCRADAQPLCLKFGVLGEHRPGTFAEFVTVPATNVQRIGDDVDDTTAAAFTLATLTAWRMVVTRARVQAGDTVLIQGIGGGVALAALQICKGIGVRVIVTSGSDDKLARAVALGADDTINYRTADVAREVRARTGKKGADVVIDSGGTESWSASLGSLGRLGRLVTCGGSTGPMLQTDVRKLFWNQWTLMGSTMGSASEFAAIAAEFRAGRLTPPVDRVFDLADGQAAFEHLATGAQFGKVVIRIG
jgi:NADPH:quinone reductase-like Zn-dependent oxidoreductase